MPSASRLPGLPNLHSHAFQRGMAGLAERAARGGDNFWTWREVMYRFLGGSIPTTSRPSPPGLCRDAGGRLHPVGEFHYLHHDPTARPTPIPPRWPRGSRAAEETGIGLTLLPVFYAHSRNFGGAPPEDGQRRFIHDVDGFARLSRRARRQIARRCPTRVVGIAPHSLRAVTPAS
jgi:formimidoylglutamate deiminase